MSEQTTPTVADKFKSLWEYTVDRVFDTLDIIIRQLTSGRWIMTVAAAWILVHYATVNTVQADKIIDICKDIVIFYFVVKNSMPPPAAGGAA